MDIDKNSLDNWIPRNEALARIAGVHPLNAELPLNVLIDEAPIIPNSLHYVRNHGAVVLNSIGKRTSYNAGW